MNREGLGKLDVILKSGTRLTFYLHDSDNDILNPNSIVMGLSQGCGLSISYRSNDIDFTIFDESDKRRKPPEINGNPITAPYESEE